MTSASSKTPDNAHTAAESLMQWLDSCPTPFHVVDRAATALVAAGFTSVSSFAGSGSQTPGSIASQGVHVVDGTVVAWRLGSPGAPFRIIGAHTDSPNLRVQPNPTVSQHGVDQLGIEIYGGVLLNSWLDRDLGIAGRVISRDGASHLFATSQATARIPQLAIHLDRDVNEKGVVLDRQQHLTPVWGMSGLSFEQWLSTQTGVSDIVAWDAHLFDINPASLVGHDQSMIASARLDNQVSCWAAIDALAGDSQTTGDSEFTTIVILNDHEEVGSSSATGAAGPLLADLVEIISAHEGLSRAQHRDRLAASWCLSADNAHGIHPNYPERHDPRHAPRLNAGPALKLNGNQRYATTARGAAHLRGIAEAHSLPLQTFVSRNNIPCGSTIGPITATVLGIEAIDIGIPQWSMHSTRETCGVADPGHLRSLMSAFLRH